MIIYQVLTRLFREGKFSSFDKASFEYFTSLGITHIWYTGVIRHSYGKSYVKGNPGSPYSISDYYDVNSYLADDGRRRMKEFDALICRTHGAGFKAILDFVPNHVSPDYSDTHGGLVTLRRHDCDWSDTDKIDYSCRENWGKLLDIICFWADRGVDGFRCDMAELVPLDFWKWLIYRAKSKYPQLEFIAEVYNISSYGAFCHAGFDHLYDKSGLYDTLRSIVSRGAPASLITKNWQRLGPLQARMLNFLENHDEQRLASKFFAGSAYAGFAALAVSALFYPCPFMLYFGQETGENAADSPDGRTSIFDWSRKIDPLAPLSPDAENVLERYREVLALKASFGGAPNYDLCYAQDASTGFDVRKHFAFMRYTSSRCLLILANFSHEDAEISLYVPPQAPQCFGSQVRMRVSAGDFAFLCK